MLGGRWSDVWGGDFFINGRIFWRVIVPGIASAFLALEVFPLMDIRAWWSIYVGIAVLAGSSLWVPFGWSFEEQNGVPDDTKYPAWIRYIGYKVLPANDDIGRNRLRGIIMKGIRGMFDGLTFVLLLPINKWALLVWLGTFTMGAIYWGISRIIVGVQHDVTVSEAGYGAVRGLLIGWLIWNADMQIAYYLINIF
jgi:hypothetical protein